MIINKLTKEIEDIACRIKSVREDCGLSDKEVAAMTDMDLEDYQALEEGRSDITFSFIYKFARICNIEITAIIDGRTPKLVDYNGKMPGRMPFRRFELCGMAGISYTLKEHYGISLRFVQTAIPVRVNDGNHSRLYLTRKQFSTEIAFSLFYQF